MNNVDYMQNNGGRITVFCEQVPDKGFIDVTKVRNICTARIRSVQEKKANGSVPGPDVEIVSASGERSLITRKELEKKFVHSSGRRIKVLHLKSNVRYCVYNMANQGEAYKALKLPDNCIGSLGSKEIKPGYYIVGKANPDGTVNRDNLTVVSSKVFRKSFKIPLQTVIKRNMHKVPNKQFGLYNPSRLAEVRGYSNQNSVRNIERSYPQENRQHQINLGTGLMDSLTSRLDTRTQSKPVAMPSQQSVRMPNMDQVNMRNTQQQTQRPNMQQAQRLNTQQVHRPTAQQLQQPQSQQPKTNYKYTVTHRVVGTTNSALLGYAVKELASGKIKQLTIEQVMKLCEMHLVDNIMLVQRENGMKYLKGNSIRIESLPQIIG